MALSSLGLRRAGRRPFSPDGRHLAAAGDEPTVALWDLITGQEALRLRGGHREVRFSAGGSRLFSLGREPTPAVKVWEAAPPADP